MTGSAAPLSPADLRRISDAIAAAEARTGGDIVVMVAARAGRYRSVGLTVALVAGLIAPWPLILLTGLGAVSIALAQAGIVLALLLPTLGESWRIRLVPKAQRRQRTHEAALREFVARGLTRTRRRTAVLIYVARAERCAEIVADDAIRARVPEARWRATIEALLGEAGRGDLAAGLVGAVGRVGDILAGILPPGEGGDALPNRVIVVE